MNENKELKLTEEQYNAALRGVYQAARIIGHRAEAGAEAWELVRGLAMMIDDLDRALNRRFLFDSVELWCASDVLRAEAQAAAVTRPRAMEGEKDDG